jgi:hypothetical protein
MNVSSDHAISYLSQPIHAKPCLNPRFRLWKGARRTRDRQKTLDHTVIEWVLNTVGNAASMIRRAQERIRRQL